MTHHDYGRLGRRKRSSGATNTDQSHDTPRHKGSLNSDFRPSQVVSRTSVSYTLTCRSYRMSIVKVTSLVLWLVITVIEFHDIIVPGASLTFIVYVDASDNSNSSCDSDQLQRSDPNYHSKSDIHQRGGIPVHRNESISISDMEKYATDVEVSNPVKFLRISCDNDYLWLSIIAMITMITYNYTSFSIIDNIVERGLWLACMIRADLVYMTLYIPDCACVYFGP
jgi:hypothetical protein